MKTCSNRAASWRPSLIVSRDLRRRVCPRPSAGRHHAAHRPGRRHDGRRTRATGVEAGGVWAESVQRALEAARPGDLVLVQADVAEEAMPWLTEKYAGRLRETTLDEMASRRRLAAAVRARAHPR